MASKRRPPVRATLRRAGFRATWRCAWPTRPPWSDCSPTSATPTAVGAIFHVREQKCELGFRVEVTTAQGALRYDLRFWGCPEWGLHRIRRFLARRIAGDAARDELPSLEPPEHIDAAS